MTEGRKLEDLARDDEFLRMVVDRCLTLHERDRRGGEEVDHFRNVLSLAVHESLRQRGVEPRPYVGLLRQFVTDLYVPTQITTAAGVDEDSEPTRLLKFLAPTPHSREDMMLNVFPSLRRSVEVQRIPYLDRLIIVFNLKLLAGGLDMREQILLGQKDASVDPLTQLLNRRGMEAYLADLLREDPKASGALLMVDADHFKSVNDERGHDVGDQALRYLASTISETVRIDPDAVVRVQEELKPEALPTAVRWGGEEMAVFLPAIDTLEGAHRIGERARRAVESGAEEHLGFPLTVTIGITTGPFSEAENMMRTADGLLYEGKAAGRNRVVSGPFNPQGVPGREVRSHPTVVPRSRKE